MTKPLTAKQRKRRKRIIFRRRVLLLLLILAIIISICLFTPFFNVKSVEVTGNEVMKAEDILSAASIPLDINTFKIRKSAVKKALLQFPEIETVKIRRKLPSKVILDVKETRECMYFPFMTGYAVTNENGKVMSLSDTAELPDLLFITGLEIKNAEICKKISVQDEVTFDIIMETMEKFRNAGLHTEMKSCHFDNLSDICVYFKDGTKIIFGKTADMDYKISVLTNILPKIDRTEGAYIDLTTPSHTIYGILDSTAEPEPSASPEPDGASNETETEAETENKTESPSPAPTATPDSASEIENENN